MGRRRLIPMAGRALFATLVLASCGPVPPAPTTTTNSPTTTTTSTSTSSTSTTTTTTTTVPAPPRTLAIAYTNVDGAPDYSRHHDVMIGQLLDANRDDVVSVGDHVVLGRYPRGLDHVAAGFGAFRTTSFPVESIDTVTGTTIAIVVAGDVKFSFGRTGINETFNESVAGAPRLTFVDMFITAFGSAEVVSVTPVSVGAPESTVSAFSAPDPSDSRHLDVDLLP